MAILKNSSAGTLSSSVTPEQNRAIVKRGDGAVTVAGTTGYDTVTLIASKDASYTAATPSAPILLGTGADDITFLPLTYP